jgi:2-keto-4-pentenoate hydratase/2-oxohepta-3-ene-1,7-dioic acid hydratase in catechol pathway
VRLVSYIVNGRPALGALDGDSIVELGGGAIAADMTEFLAGGEASLEAAREALAKGERRIDRLSVEFLPAVPRPPKIICVARNYGAHAAEANVQLLEVPNIFIRFPRSLVGHGAAVIVPRVSSQVDWEAEIAVVIGTPGKHVPRERAYEHVAGYTLFNDVSIRDWQLRTPPIQFGAGKNFDGSGPLGPSLVTRDEVPDPHDLHLELRINGEVMQSTSTAEMLFDIPTLIEHISAFATLEPGDVIATGTPAGVGHFRDPPRYLVAGDVVEVEADGLGILSNPVENEP